jgi:hypothetical protein
MQIIIIYIRLFLYVFITGCGAWLHPDALSRQVSVWKGKTGLSAGRGKAGRGHPFREAGIRPMQRLYYI